MRFMVNTDTLDVDAGRFCRCLFLSKIIELAKLIADRAKQTTKLILDITAGASNKTK